jgi:hypothetical protein
MVDLKECAGQFPIRYSNWMQLVTNRICEGISRIEAPHWVKIICSSMRVVSLGGFVLLKVWACCPRLRHVFADQHDERN